VILLAFIRAKYYTITPSINRTIQDGFAWKTRGRSRGPARLRHLTALGYSRMQLLSAIRSFINIHVDQIKTRCLPSVLWHGWLGVRKSIRGL